MALVGKLIGYVEISQGRDVFHDLFRHKPHGIASMVPDRVHGCDLLDGERGVVGSTICWNYTEDGKKKTCKEIIESVNEETHTVVYKVIGGDLVEEYKAFTIIFHGEVKGDKELVTWTFEFERPDTSVPYPTSFMDYLCTLVKDMDVHSEVTTYK